MFKMEWISVENRLPNFREHVLAYSSGRVYIAFRPEELDYNEHWVVCEDQDCSCTGMTGAITHWMPLPQPPEDK